MSTLVTRPSPPRWGQLAAMLVSVLTAVGGCAPTYHDQEAFLQKPRPLVTGENYRMMPPDVSLIESKRVREIDGHRERIRTDGRLTIPLLGNIDAAGRTPEQVSAELQARAREFYADADVSLRVVGYHSQKIFVFGEVNRPGAHSYNGANTVLSTMAAAYPTRLADPSRVQVLRPNEDGTLAHRMTVDLNRMVKNGDTRQNAVLEQGDILFVPPTGFAAVGLALQQILLPINPAASVVSGPVDIYQSGGQKPWGNDSDNHPQ